MFKLSNILHPYILVMSLVMSNKIVFESHTVRGERSVPLHQYANMWMDHQLLKTIRSWWITLEHEPLAHRTARAIGRNRGV
jgi:hypothetical protein